MTNLFLPIFERVLPDGVEFGTNFVVEFDADSVWYETSLTIAAQALRSGQKTVYHVFDHPPANIEYDLKKLGLDLTKLQGHGLFLMLDSLAVQTGGLSPVGQEDPIAQSLKIPDLSIAASVAIKKEKEGIPEDQERWLHIDDNTAILTRHNSEINVLDYWRTRVVPFDRPKRNITLYSILNGTVSESFRAQFETINDGIVDLKREDEDGEVTQLIRLRRMRGKRFDSRWQRLNLLETGEVTLAL